MWGIKGHPPSIDKKFLAESTESIVDGSDICDDNGDENNTNQSNVSKEQVEAAKYAALEEEERVMKKKRLDLMKDNIHDDVSIPTISSGTSAGEVSSSTGGSSANSKQNISIPMLLKKLMVDEWSQISLELPKTKLLRLPRPYSVNSIIAMFLQHKYNGLITNSAPEDIVENTDIYESYQDLFDGFTRYFNTSLSVVLLYRNERIQLATLRKIFEDKFPQKSMIPSEIYGVEHLMRLMVKLPTSLNSISVINTEAIQDANKVLIVLYIVYLCSC